MHSTLFAKTMRKIGLDYIPGAYVSALPAPTLATVNLITLFGMQRRWRGALVGHLAGFEISSPEPNPRYANGLRQLGFGAEATEFYDEHVEADSVHENIAAYDLAGGLARQEPQLAGQIVFGLKALLLCERDFAAHILGAFRSP
jgi:Iron-containing redox enzyme